MVIHRCLTCPRLQGIPVGSNEMTDRFLWDLRRLVADLIAYEYVGGLKEISNKNGLTTWLENYGHWGFPSEFLLYGGRAMRLQVSTGAKVHLATSKTVPLRRAVISMAKPRFGPSLVLQAVILSVVIPTL